MTVKHMVNVFFKAHDTLLFGGDQNICFVILDNFYFLVQKLGNCGSQPKVGSRNLEYWVGKKSNLSQLFEYEVTLSSLLVCASPENLNDFFPMRVVFVV